MIVTSHGEFSKSCEKLQMTVAGLKAPDREVLQQSSCAFAAGYTASLISPGDRVADLTGGLGVISKEIAKFASSVVCVEIVKERADALRDNFESLGVGNIDVVNLDCKEWLEKEKNNFNCIYIDPSRRDSRGGRLFRLEDCSPNVVSLMPVLREKTERLLIKTSPLLDLKAALSLIPEIRRFHIIESGREVKELLLEIHFDKSEVQQQKEIRCIIENPDSSVRIIEMSLDAKQDFRYLEQGEGIKEDGYIYEPSPAIMKSGNFSCLNEYGESVRKLAPNTHLFYSSAYISDFPGRIFLIKKRLNSGNLKKLKGARLSVISRNHPAKAPELESRYRFRSSNDDFIIACSTIKEKMILMAEKIHCTIL